VSRGTDLPFHSQVAEKPPLPRPRPSRPGVAARETVRSDGPSRCRPPRSGGCSAGSGWPPARPAEACNLALRASPKLGGQASRPRTPKTRAGSEHSVEYLATWLCAFRERSGSTGVEIGALAQPVDSPDAMPQSRAGEAASARQKGDSFDTYRRHRSPTKGMVSKRRYRVAADPSRAR